MLHILSSITELPLYISQHSSPISLGEKARESRGFSNSHMPLEVKLLLFSTVYPERAPMRIQELIKSTPIPQILSEKGHLIPVRTQVDYRRIFLHQRSSPLTNVQRHSCRTRAASELTGMAQSVLAKPHRFILVSDLDWTMVSIAPQRAGSCEG